LLHTISLLQVARRRHFVRGQVYDIPDDSELLKHWYVKACTERPPQPKSVSVTPPATGKPKG
jgi:hypothetical protein